MISRYKTEKNSDKVFQISSGICFSLSQGLILSHTGVYMCAHACVNTHIHLYLYQPKGSCSRLAFL